VLPLTRASCDPTFITVVPKVWVSPAKAMLSTALPSASRPLLGRPSLSPTGVTSSGGK